VLGSGAAPGPVHRMLHAARRRRSPPAGRRGCSRCRSTTAPAASPARSKCRRAGDDAIGGERGASPRRPRRSSATAFRARGTHTPAAGRTPPPAGDRATATSLPGPRRAGQASRSHPVRPYTWLPSFNSREVASPARV
jgi:hypothetical protein